MKTFAIIKLKNLSPFHLGVGKDSYDASMLDLYSDTVYSALASIRAQKGETEAMDEFLRSFKISSAYPYIDNLYFLPRPLGKLNIDDSTALRLRKELKKTKYIELACFNKLIKGEKLSIKATQLKDSFILSEQDSVGFVEPYQSSLGQRVQVARDGVDDAKPFFFDWVYFRENAGLYFIIDAPPASITQLTLLFERLGTSGIGSDRTVGGGQFKCEKSSITLDIPAESDAALLMSLYIPSKEEIPLLNLPNSCYSLIKRGGYMSGSSVMEFRHLRRKSVYMFTNGSVFETSPSLKGEIVNVSPTWNDTRMHPVWRCGTPFLIPIKR